MSCCLKRWLWFRQEGRVEPVVSGLEVNLVPLGQGLALALVEMASVAEPLG